MLKKYSVTKPVSLFLQPLKGELSEWLKEHAWKVCIGETLSRVRIPHSPPSPAEALAQAGCTLPRRRAAHYLAGGLHITSQAGCTLPRRQRIILPGRPQLLCQLVYQFLICIFTGYIDALVRIVLMIKKLPCKEFPRLITSLVPFIPFNIPVAVGSD